MTAKVGRALDEYLDDSGVSLTRRVSDSLDGPADRMPASIAFDGNIYRRRSADGNRSGSTNVQALAAIRRLARSCAANSIGPSMEIPTRLLGEYMVDVFAAANQARVPWMQALHEFEQLRSEAMPSLSLRPWDHWVDYFDGKATEADRGKLQGNHHPAVVGLVSNDVGQFVGNLLHDAYSVRHSMRSQPAVADLSTEYHVPTWWLVDFGVALTVDEACRFLDRAVGGRPTNRYLSNRWDPPIERFTREAYELRSDRSLRDGERLLVTPGEALAVTLH